jgi:hypothetical protein
VAPDFEPDIAEAVFRVDMTLGATGPGTLTCCRRPAAHEVIYRRDGSVGKISHKPGV